jgi:cytochrome c
MFKTIRKSIHERKETDIMFKTIRTLALASGAVLIMAPAAYAFDADAAQELFKENNCTKCHAPAKEKKGPSFKKIAEKYAGKPDSMDKLIHHITSGEKVKFADGTEEDHKIIDTKDKAQQQNLIEWILSFK